MANQRYGRTFPPGGSTQAASPRGERGGRRGRERAHAGEELHGPQRRPGARRPGRAGAASSGAAGGNSCTTCRAVARAWEPPGVSAPTPGGDRGVYVVATCRAVARARGALRRAKVGAARASPKTSRDRPKLVEFARRWPRLSHILPGSPENWTALLKNCPMTAKFAPKRTLRARTWATPGATDRLPTCKFGSLAKERRRLHNCSLNSEP